MNKIQKIHRENMKSEIPEFAIGDTVQVDMRIVEGGKERVQAFTGTVIGRHGEGIAESVTLRRVSFGQGLERVIPLHSPRLAGLTVVRHGSVRRAKLYYLRDMVGKSARVKERQVES
ncbi:MAG: 50S ribosomal protein L19 [Lentisphaerae bacterium]|nr:50S ribosomal protein L19 [Lentisphaerota bacterium]